MPEDLIASKAALRREMRARLKAITLEQRALASRELYARLRQQLVWGSAQTILFFAAMLDEPDLWPLLAESLAGGKTVALPRHVAEKGCYVAAQISDATTDLYAGKFGIREPTDACPEISLTATDLVLVPGIAFDLQGRRLGRGRGFYDRLLAEVGGIKCGVAFDEQIVGEVPIGPSDAGVNCLVTPTRWMENCHP